jgi:hypothetical protein
MNSTDTMKLAQEAAQKREKLSALRDQFATAVLSGLCADSDYYARNKLELARTCYSLADAMLAVREEASK